MARARASYAAFLRGVSPMNARMPDLKRCFEAAGLLEIEIAWRAGEDAQNERRRLLGWQSRLKF